LKVEGCITDITDLVLHRNLKNISSSILKKLKKARFFIKNQHNPDGGFRGRTTQSDVFYTFFAVASLNMLNVHAEVSSAATARFISKCYCKNGGFCATPLKKNSTLVHTTAALLTLQILDSQHIYKKWKTTILHYLSTLAHKNGGFMAEETDKFPNIYSTFLAFIALACLDADFKKYREKTVKFVTKLQHKDGGFKSSLNSRIATTNSTAAAIALCAYLDPDVINIERTKDFLHSMYTKIGGFKAAMYAPVPDMLSTYSAVTSLYILECLDIIDERKCKNFVLSLQHKNGGFTLLPNEQIADTECTYYGLATIGMFENADVEHL
jgi:prenyltransferase beta subunit